MLQKCLLFHILIPIVYCLKNDNRKFEKTISIIENKFAFSHYLINQNVGICGATRHVLYYRPLYSVSE